MTLPTLGRGQKRRLLERTRGTLATASAPRRGVPGMPGRASPPGSAVEIDDGYATLGLLGGLDVLPGLGPLEGGAMEGQLETRGLDRPG